MVRNYEKKGKKKVSPTKLKKGLELVKKGYSLRQAGKESGVNYVCLQRLSKSTQLYSTIDDIPPSVLMLSHNSRSVFTNEIENSIAEYCKEMALIGYGLTVDIVREVAFETAVRNNITIPSNWEKNNKAGIDWYHGFMKRHPQLSVRTPEGCSTARAMAFNQHNVTLFQDKLEECLRRYPCFADGSRVGNLDETSTSTVQNVWKIISPKGVKQVHKIKTAERGVSVTTCCAVTAYGSVIPPVMIFPRKKFVSNMLINCFPCTLGLANENGYMTRETFLKVIQHIVKHTAASKENPFLLLLDNVETHLSLDALTFAKENGLTLLTFPPHCTHKLQPLDVSFFGPFKAFYDAAINSWLMQNPGKSVTIYHIAGFVNTALLKAGNVGTIIAGFAKPGIIPFDRFVFTEADFIMSTVTRIDPNSTVEVLAVVPANESLTTEKVVPHANQESSSTTPEIQTIEATTSSIRSVCNTSPFIGPKEFRGLPKVQETEQKRKPRRKGKCFIPTDTPEKEEIEERQKAKEDKIKRTEENKRKREEKRAEASRKKGRRTTKRVLSFSADSDPDNDLLKLTELPSLKSSALPTLASPPSEGDYVLVLFAGRDNKYFVGKIIGEIDDEGDLEISYLRCLKKSLGFVLPQVPDICSVKVTDIKAILPKPKSHPGKTKRQQATLVFEYDFNDLNLG